jgi:hypothetical protein
MRFTRQCLRGWSRAEKELASAHDRGTGRSPEEAVTSYVNALVGLFGRDQDLVCLMQRESLTEGSRLAEFLPVGVGRPDAVGHTL